MVLDQLSVLPNQVYHDCHIANLRTDSQQLLSVPTSIVEGYNFSYHGIWGIWEGFRPVHRPFSANPTPRIPSRGLLLDTAPSSIYSHNADPLLHRAGPRPTGRGRSLPPPDHNHDDFLDAISIVNTRRDNGKIPWQPAVRTHKLAQRQLALYLCGWNLADGDLNHAIKKYLAPLCILYSNAYQLSIKVGERAQILSGSLLACLHQAIQSRHRPSPTK